MFRALALVFVLPLTAVAEDPPATKPADQLDRILAVLHEKKAKSFGDESIRTYSLTAVLNRLEKEFKGDGLKFVIREDLFRQIYPDRVTDREPFGDQKFCVTVYSKGLTVHEFLTRALADLNVVHLVRKNRIEITTPEAANPFGLQQAALHEKKVSSFRKASIKGLTLAAVMNELEHEFREDGLKIVIREDVFRSRNPDQEAFSQVRFVGDLKPSGLTLHELLILALADIDATYLVRRSYLEITTAEAAVAECYPKDPKGGTAQARLRREPLVSYHSNRQPLSEALRAISTCYGKSVVIDPDTINRGPGGDRWERDVAPHWMNVPFPTAVRLLATEAELGVKEKDGVLTITNPVKKKK